MLASVHIENIALITKLDLDFCKGFSVFTGETGAGKSIIIDAIGFALGNRSERDIIRTGEESATVEALFCDLSAQTLEKCASCGVEPDEEGCLFIRRSISSEGKGSVRINGRQVPLSLLREISSYLVNIHGQHHNGELLNSDKHLGILDAYGMYEKELNEYREVFREYTALCKKRDSLLLDEKEKKRTTDVLRFQADEIKKAKIKIGEEEKLLAERTLLRNYEKTANAVTAAAGSLYDAPHSAFEQIGKAVSAVKNVRDIVPRAEEYLEKLEDFKYQILDIAELLKENLGSDGETPDAALDRVESRLDTISKLKMKYGADEGEILAFLKDCESRLSEMELSDVMSAEITAKLEKLRPVLDEKAKALSKRRKESADKLSSLVMREFKYLDMNGVKFQVALTPTECGNNGADDAEFQICANVGEPFLPLSRTASGGELARIMLAIKCVIAEKDSVETMIFDEVDAGVSGKTARKIGLKMLEISKDREVLCVTHSAQIASLGDCHYFVSKSEKDGRTSTTAVELTGEERVGEVARIISGIGVTETARKAAAELIENRTEDIPLNE